MGKPEGMPELSQKERDTYQEFLDSFLHKLERTAEESEGFIYVPPENIVIIPGKDGQGGVIEIREPEELKGIDAFNVRDQFEKNHLDSLLAPESEFQNKVFRGELNSKEFKPQFGGRLALSNIKFYVSPQGTMFSVPVIADTGQYFSRHAKLPGTNLARGRRFVDAKILVSGASRGESNTLSEAAKAHPRERVISNSKPIEAGFWTLRLVSNDGRKQTEIPNCHIYRDPETGTFEIIRMEKQYIFQKEDDLDTKINVAPWLKRAHFLASYDKLKKAKPGQPLELEKLYFNNQPIKDIKELPKNYQSLFEIKNEKFYLKELKMVPPLAAFHEMEQKVINKTPDDAKAEIKRYLGGVFEKLVENALNISPEGEAMDVNRPFTEKMKRGQVGDPLFSGKIKKNEESNSVDVPSENELIRLEKDNPQYFPPAFKNWIKDLKRKKIEVKPDFILPDGTFLEVKLSAAEAIANRDQLFRMVLYLLANKKPIKIKYFTADDHSTVDPDFSEIRYESIFKDEKLEEIIRKHKLSKDFDYWNGKLKKK